MYEKLIISCFNTFHMKKIEKIENQIFLMCFADGNLTNFVDIIFCHKMLLSCTITKKKLKIEQNTGILKNTKTVHLEQK